MISPGWQSSTSQMASSVEKRIAFTFLVFRLDRFTVDIPTRSDNSFREIFLSAITRSKRNIIATSIPPTIFDPALFACKTRPDNASKNDQQNSGNQVDPIAQYKKSIGTKLNSGRSVTSHSRDQNRY